MKKIILISFILILFTISCKKEIDISSVLLQKRLVVNALLNDQDQIAIAVSTSTSYQDSVAPPPFTTATVIVKNSSGAELPCNYNPLTRKYESTQIPITGAYYSVNVSATGFPEVFASLTVPEKGSKGKNTWLDSTAIDSTGFPTGTVTVSISDNGSNKNYYRISLFYYDIISAEWRVIKPNLQDATLQNQSIFPQDGTVVFSDQSFNGLNKNIGFITPFGFALQSPKFLILTENLSNEYFQYFNSIDLYKKSTGLFSEPAQVFSNIKNGLGIFAASSIQRDTIK